MEIRAMVKREKRRKVWKRILSVMMCLVAFVTTYALILPAITMESALTINPDMSAEHLRARMGIDC
jgi:hypothetical protein